MNSQSTTTTACSFPALLASILLLIATGWTQSVRADPQHNLLFFLSLEGFDKFSSSPSELDDFDGHSAADVLYTYNNDRFSFLGEYILSNTESELERLKAGWQVNDQTLFWFGRFHTISKLWTTEFHHGQFLQTSISRPGLEEWEDESGPMPSHITGLTLEHDIERSNNSTIGISLAAGLGAKFEGQELVPFDFLDSKSDHDFALNYRMTYRPDLLSINQIGIALAWNDISVISESSPDLTDLRAIRQTTISLFADWSWADWRLLTNWVYFHNEMRYFDTNIDDKFASSYVQVEYKTANEWTLFGRAEFSISEDDSRYLRLLPDFISNRYMLGLRWDFADTQSLTLETAKTKTQGVDGIHNRFNELRFQWSAVFP